MLIMFIDAIWGNQATGSEQEFLLTWINFYPSIDE